MALVPFLVLTMGLACGALIARALGIPSIPLAGIGGFAAMLAYGLGGKGRPIHREGLWAEGMGMLGAGFAVAPLLASHWLMGMLISGASWGLSLLVRGAIMRRRDPENGAS